MSDYDEERLGKIVQLAKKGVGGEKENAIRIVKNMCRRYDLNFDEVMDGREVLTEYFLEYKRGEKNLAHQVIAKYGAYDEKHSIYTYRWGARKGKFYFETSAEKYIECMNAWSVLAPLMKKELSKVRKAVFYGFLEKHDLYSKSKKGGKTRNISREEYDARMMGSHLAGNMEDANIRKQLSSYKLK